MITFNYCGYNLLFCDYSEFIVSYHLKTNFEYDHHYFPVYIFWKNDYDS